MTYSGDTYDVAIAGAGPAGTSAAIHLATQGARVLLVEQKRFPRAKLCGEFISPECLQHFERLRVSDQMISAGPATLTQTVFYSRKGRSINVPSEWF
ncbi:MAG: FAD-dependent monooxygenase, partial [Pyrinomonadaceae bacterium]|nr:FAD-dependent monooxygenase [Pyrinomonadaceae bacterium]